MWRLVAFIGFCAAFVYTYNVYLLDYCKQYPRTFILILISIPVIFFILIVCKVFMILGAAIDAVEGKGRDAVKKLFGSWW
jgi:hypothetical protein